MSALRLGELCAGYGGLGMAVEEVFGATTTWFSEFDAAPSKILAHHWPHVPNYGDMTKIDWAAIEPVDIISGGTPCQDLSAAGRRAGMTEGTRSNLWVQMREAIAIQRPRYVVWENVRGAFSAEASSDLEQCPGCVGDASDGRVFLRALGRVLGDLSDLGYDCQWRGLRAADVGACHGRYRIFVLATNASSPGAWLHPCASGQERRQASPWGAALVRPEHGEVVAKGRESSDSKPHANAYDLGYQRGWEARGRRLGLTNSGEPTPDASSKGLAVGGSGGITPSPHAGTAPVGDSSPLTNWGAYQPAIRCWEATLGRRAPAPTELSTKGFQRLSPRFTEWMMGLPDGWVTDPAIGITRNEQIKACGNGVVPQQAMAALRDMLAAFQTAEVAA